MAEVPATQAWVEQLVTERIATMQGSMSVDLRAEFDASQARMRTSLEQLSSATETAVLLKFTDAEARQNTKFQEANAKFAAE